MSGLVFWSRPRTSAHKAGSARDTKDYIRYFMSDHVNITFTSVPVWTLDKDFALETLTLLKDPESGPRVQWSDGVPHGTWSLEEYVVDSGDYTLYLNITHTKSSDETNPQANLRSRWYELLWGTYDWVKRPDADDDELPWSVFLSPLVGHLPRTRAPPSEQRDASACLHGCFARLTSFARRGR